MRSLVWFREDLRTFDNTALHYAAEKSHDGIIGLYIINPQMWHDHDTAACRVEFILRGLQTLSVELQQLNIPLIVLSVENTQAIPVTILTLMHELKLAALFFNRQYEINELRRDQAVNQFLQNKQIACYEFDDQTILPPTMVTTQQGACFKVFTAYKRAWYQVFLQQYSGMLWPRPKKQRPLSVQSSTIPNHIPGFHSTIHPATWPAGEMAAKKRLIHFIEQQLSSYQKTRDFPARNGTSQLSPYLASGMISARECFYAAYKANGCELDTGKKGAIVWMAELIWREFYKSILMATPRISMHRAYKLETEKIKWQFNQTLFDAWQQGQTGIPIVDAAMRQLNAVGWMHNRLRMITAMFFTKNLFFDWRLGEKYFMQHLIDGDLAANNGGWQWCASTGTDAAPYFRVFNPLRQSERFDPDGNFIRQYCPELAHLNTKQLHEQQSPILVDLAASRKYAIAKFKEI